MKKILTAFFILSATVAACYYDSEEALYPSLGGGCDTASVKFSTSVKPLLAANCLSCHSNSTAPSFGNNIKLENYADVKTNSAALAGSIRHNPGFSPMPKNGGKLNSCSIATIDIWIRNGMLND
jgi:hypothetical protein